MSNICERDKKSHQRMNFRKMAKGEGGHFQSKKLCCRFWTLNRVFWAWNGYKFATWFSENEGEGGQTPFGTFPFWWRHLSLRVQFEYTLDVILHRIWQQVYRNADKNQTGVYIWSSPILANPLQRCNSQGYVSTDCGKTIVADLWLPCQTERSLWVHWGYTTDFTCPFLSDPSPIIVYPCH